VLGRLIGWVATTLSPYPLNVDRLEAVYNKNIVAELRETFAAKFGISLNNCVGELHQ
jgi:hypothetical protein